MKETLESAYNNNQWLSQKILGWKSLTIFPLNLQFSSPRTTDQTCDVVVYSPYDNTVSRASLVMRTAPHKNQGWHYTVETQHYRISGKEVELESKLRLAPKNSRNLGINKKHPQYFWFDTKHPSYKEKATKAEYQKLPESSILVLANAVEVFIAAAGESGTVSRYSEYELSYEVSPLNSELEMDIDAVFNSLFRYIGSELSLDEALELTVKSNSLPDLKKDLLIKGIERELTSITEEDIPLYLEVDKKFGIITPAEVLDFIKAKPLSKGRIIERLDKMVSIFKDRKVKLSGEAYNYHRKEESQSKLILELTYVNAILWRHLGGMNAHSYLTANAQKYFDLILARLVAEGASLTEVGNLLFEHPSVYGLDTSAIGIIYEKLGKMPDAFFTCFKSSQNFHELIALHQKLNRVEEQVTT